MLQRMVEDAGGSFVFASVDAMAIVSTEQGGLIACPGGSERMVPPGKRKPVETIKALTWTEVDAIRQRFRALVPYDRELLPDLWRLEDENFDVSGRCRQLWADAIRGSHYVLFNRDDRGEPELRATCGAGDAEDGDSLSVEDAALRKVSEHGLAHVLDKTRIREASLWLLREALGLPAPEPAWLDDPAVSRLTISSPELLRPFGGLNEGKAYADTVKPFCFMLGAVRQRSVLPDASAGLLIAPYESDGSKLLDLPWVDRSTGQPYRVTTATAGLRVAGMAHIKTLRDVLNDYRRSFERKMLASGGRPCGEESRGLLTPRHVAAQGLPALIGKEANRLEDRQAGLIRNVGEVLNVYNQPDIDRRTWDDLALPVLRDIRPRQQLAEAAGLHPGGLRAVLNSRTLPHPQVRAALQDAAIKHARWRLYEDGVDVAGMGGFALLRAYIDHSHRQRLCPVDGTPLTDPRQRTCSAVCRQRAYRERRFA